jgi:hypothetical protein
MAKRFTDTNKYKKPFIRGLQGPYKLLWDYLYHDCDHAGIWIVDFAIAQVYLGSDMPVNRVDALRFFNADEERIVEIDGGKKWLIVPFIHFQYGILDPRNRVHNSVLIELQKQKVHKGLISSLQGAKDKDIDKDKDKDKELEGGAGGNKPAEINIAFDVFWDMYDKKVDRAKCEVKWTRLTDKERTECIQRLPDYIRSTPEKSFRRDPETYLNNKSWENEIINGKSVNGGKPKTRLQMIYEQKMAEEEGL